MEKLKSKALLALGWLIIITGLALGPIPGPGGIPIIAAGAVLVMSQSLAARRQFIRLQKRFPKLMGSIRRFLQRKRHTKDDREK